MIYISDHQMKELDHWSLFGWYNLPKRYQDSAREKLHERVEAGEDLLTILGLSKECSYYAKKLYDNLCPISITMYERITGNKYVMNATIRETTTKKCQRCGKILRNAREGTGYCRACWCAMGMPHYDHTHANLGNLTDGMSSLAKSKPVTKQEEAHWERMAKKR